ncbi:MAG TPA: hypothetical protein PLP23_16515, partial [Panacibacter sp.]|nr:hypothetical protein [Panacibacter sp.]
MRKTIFLTLLGVAFVLFTNAQVANYTFTQSSNTFSAISGGTVISFAGTTTAWDDNVTSINIPFTFNFNGTGYTTCSVNSNGYITFGATASSASGYTPISSTTGYAGTVSAFARDLINNATAISYTTINSSPNRIFIVEWKNARRYNGSAVSGDVLNFQIRLYETSNVAEVMYGTCTATNTTGLTTQVGLRGSANTDYHDRSGAGAWNATTTGASNAATVNSTNTLMPGSGLTFTYTPSPGVTFTQTHPVAGAINQNSTGNIIAALQMAVSNVGPVTPTSFVFTTAGTYSGTNDITNFKLYQNNSSSLGGATLLQTITAPASGSTLTFNSGFTTVSASTTTYYLIVVDVPATALNGNTVNISSTSFSNLNFTNSATIKSGTNPLPASNTQTIKGPLATITQTHPAAGFINQNSTNNIIASFSVVPSNAAITPTGLTFTTAGTYAATTDITNFKLYQNSSNNLTGATLIGTVTATGTGTTMSISGTGNSIGIAATGYLLLVSDVPSTAINGNTVSITTTVLSNFSFTSTGTVSKTGPANPAPASNTQTIKGPLATITQTHPA